MGARESEVQGTTLHEDNPKNPMRCVADVACKKAGP